MKNRKQKIIAVMLILVVMWTGCSNSTNNPAIGNEELKTSAYPDYFLPIISELEGSETAVSYERPTYGLTLCHTKTPEDGITMAYAKTNASSSNGFQYHLNWLVLNDGRTLENVTIDLERYQVEDNQWSDDGVFYVEETDSILLKFDILFVADEEDTGPSILVVQIPAEHPSKYTISTYNNAELKKASLWGSATCQLGAALYESLNASESKNIWEFNMVSKLFNSLSYVCDSCDEIIDEMIEEKALENDCVTSYAVELAQEDVTVYSGTVFGATDEEKIVTVYLAYRGRDLIDVLVVDAVTNTAELR